MFETLRSKASNTKDRLVPFGKDNLSVTKLFDNILHTGSDEFLNSFGFIGKVVSEFPRVDAVQYKDKVIIRYDLERLPRENVTLQVLNNELVLQGIEIEDTSPEDSLEEGAKYLIHEIPSTRKSRQFYRSFSLGHSFDQTGISAKWNENVLEVTLPRMDNSTELNKVVSIEV